MPIFDTRFAEGDVEIAPGEGTVGARTREKTMTAIWHNSGGKWSELQPVGFPDEAALHDLVEESPEMLRLSGNPRLAILGREVRLGSGAADLVAIEPNGRLAVIEIKLRANPEARRAVVAQVLAYAAHLYRIGFETLERDLSRHLAGRGFTSIADALTDLTQSPVSSADLRVSAESYLESGAFRLVLVLDEVPEELARVVGYLEAIGRGVVVDLVQVSAYDAGGVRLMVPQRVEPERIGPANREPRAQRDSPTPVSAPGTGEFVDAISDAPPEHRERLQQLAAWVEDLERQGLATVVTTHGTTRKTLAPRVRGTDSGLITVVTDSGGSIWPWPTVFARKAPQTLKILEEPFGLPLPNLKPTQIDDELLQILTAAYREAQSGDAAPVS